MIEIPLSRSTDERLQRLLAFANEVLDVCDELGIDPILDGSLAVRIHTQDAAITVRDVDLNCSEADFHELKSAMKSKAIDCKIRPWRVLQVRRDGLKIEFGAIEYWMQGINGPFETVTIGKHRVRMVNREALRELYQRGFDATIDDPEQREKHEATASKLTILDSTASPPT